MRMKSGNHHEVLNFFLFLVILISGCQATPSAGPLASNPGIADIQGCGHTSPYAGRTVDGLRGIVTSKIFNGFYMQDASGDGIDCSSDAIFVFTDQFPEVQVGDLAEVRGTVVEFYPGKPEDHNLTITEISKPTLRILAHHQELPQAVVIGYGGRELPDKIIEDDQFMKFDPQSDGIDFYESLESMLVQVNRGVVVGPRNPFNEIVIISPDQLPAEGLAEDGALVLKEDDRNPERIILNLNSANDEVVNLGAELGQNIQGIVDYSVGNYKLNVFGVIDFRNIEHTPVDLPADDDALTLVSYNVENLSPLDNPSRFSEVARDLTEALNTPDIIVLHEIMDNSGVEDDGITSADQTISKLIASIRTRSGVEYAFAQIDPQNNQDGGINGGNIRSVILFREDRGIILDEKAPKSFFSSNPTLIQEGHWRFQGSRKPLAAYFRKNDTVFVVIAVHLTSRGADSPFYGDLQPIEKPEEQERNEQALMINQFAASFLKQNPEIRVIVAGDINDDPWSRTVEALAGKSLINLGKNRTDGPQFSYILDGNAMQLDYVFTNPVPGINDRFIVVHLNSLFDYSLQVSDHDPVMALINLPDSP